MSSEYSVATFSFAITTTKRATHPRTVETRCLRSNPAASHVQRELRLQKGCARIVYFTQPCPSRPSVTRVAAACAEGWPPFLRQPGAPVPPAGPPSRQRGAELHGPFGHFRRALGSVRVRGGAGAPGRVRAELAGPSQCARAGASCSPGPPLPHAPPLPPASERPPRLRRQRLESACRPRGGGGRREGRGGRLELPRVGPRETRTLRPREGRPGPGRCTPRAEAEPGPAAPRLSVPACAERWRMSFSGSR